MVIFTDPNNHFQLEMFGDIHRHLGIMNYFNVALFQVVLVEISLQIVYYYNYKIGLKNEHVALFYLLSGSQSLREFGVKIP